MEIQAYFDNISEQIVSELNTCKNNIRIAVAWFTDDEIFDLLCSKAQEDISIDLVLIDDEINRGSGIEFDDLTDAGGDVYWISKATKGKGIMHNKFCIIDDKTIITGSYNWSRQAKKNYENITVINDDPKLMIQYLNEFNYIKSNLTGDAFEPVKINTDMILKRLEALKTVITLEDIEDIRMQTGKLSSLIEDYDNRSWDALSDIELILELVENTHYKEAVTKMDKLLQKQRQVTVYENPEIPALKLEIRGLEYQVFSLQNEKIETEKLIFTFEIRHNQELGELTIKILHLKHEKLKKQVKGDKSKKAAFESAKKDFKDYQEGFEELTKEKIVDLTEDEEKEIKRIYRKASHKCHPDVVSEEFEKQAHEIFSQLNDAYNRNDLDKVKELANLLDKSEPFIPRSETVTEKGKLMMKISEMKRVRQDILESLRILKESEVYATIISIDDWDDYFDDCKKRLGEELEKFQKEMKSLNK
jgi:hypothetical protein